MTYLTFNKMTTFKISGTLIKNYFHCKRQAWLYSRGINFRNETTKLGQTIHNENEAKEYIIDNIKVDDIDFKKNELIEYKKSSSNIEGSKMQIMFYLDILYEKGIYMKGRIKDIDFGDETIVDLDKKEVNQLKDEINEFLQNKTPPKPTKNKNCKKCSFYDYCWS